MGTDEKPNVEEDGLAFVKQALSSPGEFLASAVEPSSVSEGPPPVLPIQMIPTDKLVEAEDNPNVQDGSRFGVLVSLIKDLGFAQNLQVADMGDGTFMVVGGNHRLRAAKVLGMKELPCVVLDLNTEGDSLDAAIELVRLNVPRGKLDPIKFTALFNRLKKQFGAAALRSRMGLTDEAAFNALYRRAVEGLPPSVRRRLDEAKDDVHTVEGLAKVVQRIMAEAGGDVNNSFLVFDFGGKEHLIVRCSELTWASVMSVVKECRAERWDINKMMSALLSVPLADALKLLGEEAKSVEEHI